MIYFTSDLHFGDKGIIKNERVRFGTIEEHDEFIIEAINKKVKATDTLYILGDVGNPEKLRYLNGTKHLLLGNHDKQSMKVYQSYVKEVYKTPQYFSERILLSHDPHPVRASTLNVHGHLHGSKMATHNHLNISIHVVDYKVYSEVELSQLVGDLPKPNEKFLEEWYAPYYIFAEPRSDVFADRHGRVDLEMTKKLRASLYKDR